MHIHPPNYVCVCIQIGMVGAKLVQGTGSVCSIFIINITFSFLTCPGSAFFGGICMSVKAHVALLSMPPLRSQSIKDARHWHSPALWAFLAAWHWSDVMPLLIHAPSISADLQPSPILEKSKFKGHLIYVTAFIYKPRTRCNKLIHNPYMFINLYRWPII